jgi:hypothetical protein
MRAPHPGVGSSSMMYRGSRHRPGPDPGRDHLWHHGTLYGDITLKDGRVQQTNFDTYQMLRIHNAPAIEVHIVESTESPGGMGEAGTSAIVPAIANAIFAATGKRLRKMPVDPAGLRLPT